MAVIALIALLVRCSSGHAKNPGGSIQFRADKTIVSKVSDGADKVFTVAVTIVTVAELEGLPFMVTSTLAYSKRKMMADKASRQELPAFETMASATTICSDRTEALTMNPMTKVEAYIGGKKSDPPHKKSKLSPMLGFLLIEGITQNTNVSIYLPVGVGDDEASQSSKGKAILHWGFQPGRNFEAAIPESPISHVFQFNLDKEGGGVAAQMTDFVIHIHWKGAAGLVLGGSTGYIDAESQLIQRDDKKKNYFRKVIDGMAVGSLCCVANAYHLYEMKEVPCSEELAHWPLLENDFILLVIVGVKDPCGLGVQDAVQLWEMTVVHKIFHVSMLKESKFPTAKEDIGMNGFEGVQAAILSEHDDYLLQIFENQEVMGNGLGLDSWDLAGHYYSASITSSSFFKIWDPGGRLSSAIMLWLSIPSPAGLVDDWGLQVQPAEAIAVRKKTSTVN